MLMRVRLPLSAHESPGEHATTRKRARLTDIKAASLAQPCRRDKSRLQIRFDGFSATFKTMAGLFHAPKGRLRKTKADMID